MGVNIRWHSSASRCTGDRNISITAQVTSVLQPLVSGGSASYRKHPIKERRLVGRPDPEMIANLKCVKTSGLGSGCVGIKPHSLASQGGKLVYNRNYAGMI